MKNLILLLMISASLGLTAPVLAGQQYTFPRTTRTVYVPVYVPVPVYTTRTYRPAAPAPRRQWNVSTVPSWRTGPVISKGKAPAPVRPVRHSPKPQHIINPFYKGT